MMFEEIKSFLKKEGFDEAAITPHTLLIDNLGIDSTEMVDLCCKLSKLYSITLHPGAFNSIAELITAIESLRNNKHRTSVTEGIRLDVSRTEITPVINKGGLIHVLISPKTVQSTKLILGTVQLKPGEELAAHFHTYSEESVYVCSGKGCITVAGRSIGLFPGTAVLIPAGSAHSITNNGLETLEMVFASAPPAPEGKAGDNLIAGKQTGD